MEVLPCSRMTLDGYAIPREAPGPRPSDPGGHLPDDVPVPAPRRQGDPAQAPEQDLLPDQRGRPRSGAGGGGAGPEAGPRLVLLLLPRPGPDAPARHDPPRHAPGRSGGEGRPELRRAPDAIPLEQPR